jgi:signal transduction histidine kinase
MVIGLTGLAVAQAVGFVALAAALHVAAERRVEQNARATSSEVAGLIRAGKLPDTIAASGLEIVQVLDDQGRVVSASTNADRLSALLTPSEVSQALDGSLTVSGSRVALDSELRVWAERVSAGPRPYTIIVAEPDQALVSSDALLRRILLISFPILLLVLGAVAWRVIGAAMRPVEEMRAAADQISGSGRGDRLPVPPSTDELHALAETLNSMLDRLDRAREREAAFVADAAHELRSPISSIRMQVDVARRLGDDSELTEGLHEDIDRLARLVDDLLALARLDASQAGATELPPTTAVPVLDILHRAAETSAGSDVVVLDGADADVCMAPGELDRVLDNLVGNARRHAAHVWLSTRRQGARVVIVVDDDGPGVPEADRDRVFERFTRLDDARDRGAGGSGLGLAIVRHLVTSRHGEVRLSNAPAGGLRVEVELPAAERDRTGVDQSRG